MRIIRLNEPPNPSLLLSIFLSNYPQFPILFILLFPSFCCPIIRERDSIWFGMISLPLYMKIDLKRIMAMHLTHFWCLFTQSTTFEILLSPNHKMSLKWSKTKCVLLLRLKIANELKMSYGYVFDKLLRFDDRNYHTWDNFGTKT